MRVEGTEDVDGRRNQFRTSLVRGLVIASGAVALAFTAGIGLSTGPLMAVFPFASFVTAVVCAQLLRQNRVTLAARAMLVTDLALICVSGVIDPDPFTNPGGAQLIAVLVTAFTILEGGRRALPYLVLACVGMIGTDVRLGLFDDNAVAATAGLVLRWVALTVAWIVAGAFAEYQRKNEEAMRKQVTDLSLVVHESERIASGDLGGEVRGAGRAADIVGRLQQGLRGIVDGLKEGVLVLGQTAQRLGDMSQEQERGASKQAAAVAQARQVVEGMAASSRRIADGAGGVLGNAEATLDTGRHAAGRLETLTSHAGRVTELLESITDIASKSEILALNAGLEGIRAGEAGRGFSLVANELQRLSESTMATIRDAKGVVDDIRDSSTKTVAAVDETLGLARATAEVARSISDITQRQRSSAEELASSMSEIEDVATRSVQSSRDTRQTVDTMRDLSAQLETAAAAFQT